MNDIRGDELADICVAEAVWGGSFLGGNGQKKGGTNGSLFVPGGQ